MTKKRVRFAIQPDLSWEAFTGGGKCDKTEFETISIPERALPQLVADIQAYLNRNYGKKMD